MSLIPRIVYAGGAVSLSSIRTGFSLGSVDTNGANYLCYALTASTIANSIDITSLKLQESNDNSTFVDIPNAAFATTTVFNGTSISNRTAAFFVKLSNGRRRYIRALLTTTATAVTTIDATIAVLLDNASEPTNTAGVSIVANHVITI